MIDIDKLEALLAADAGIPDVPNADSKPHWMAVYACYDAAPELIAELRRLRAIEAAARAYVDLTPDRVDYVPMLFAKLQAAVAATGHGESCVQPPRQ